MGDFLITLATCFLLLGAGRFGRRRTDLGLVVVALAALFVYTDGFDFHGDGTFVHHHDAGHYYLGARYFAELGYTDLYVAMLAAEVESVGHSSGAVARDLRTNLQVATVQLLERSGAVRARFTTQRWGDFRRDADYFRRSMRTLYGDFLNDHGFNPTPVWTLVGGTLAHCVTPGDATGILLLCLLDVFLVTLTVVAVALSFGRRAALLGLIFFLTAVGGDFDWVGGAFLRQLWLCALVSAVCCLQCRRHVAAGALLALSTALRIFPAVFLIGIAVQVAVAVAARCPPRRSHLRFLGAFAATSIALVAATAIFPLPGTLSHCVTPGGAAGWTAWQLFAANLEVYVESSAMNYLGFGQAVITLVSSLTAMGVGWLGGLLTGGAAVVSVGIAVWLAGRRDDVGATALGCLVLYGCLTMPAYYYSFLWLLILAHRRQPRVLAGLFAVEALTWAISGLDLGIELYIVQSLLWLFFFGVLYVEDIQQAKFRSLLPSLP